MNPRSKKSIHDWRVTIVMQLGILAFILVIIFSAALLRPANIPSEPIVELSDVPARQTNSAALTESLSDVVVRGEAAFVWDVKAKQVLYSKNADRPLPLASITKLMTALLSYELLDQDTTGTISERAIRQDGTNGLSAGDSLSLEQLNQLSLIASSNDAAYALGANVGSSLGDQDPYAQFVSGMNIRAEELGLKTLSFKNTTGLDISVSEPGAVGSARETSHLLEHILMEYPEVLEPTKRGEARVFNEDGSYYDVTNTNDALYAIPNLLASKTGYTDLAGGNLTVAFDAGFDRPIIVTVLGSTRDERFSDVLRLITAIRDHSDSL